MIETAYTQGEAMGLMVLCEDEAAQARQVLMWGQEAAQARQVLVWGQEAAQARQVLVFVWGGK